MKDDHHSSPVFKSAVRFLSGTLLSRLTGLVRDLSMAWCFGSHPAVAAFMVAFRFSNLIRRLFGEGQMSNGFIPHFETLRASSEESGARFFRDLFSTLGLTLALVILGIEAGLFGWLQIGVGEDTAEILRLTMLMLPGILFICLFGLGAALMQCEKQFFLSGFAPAAFNAVWIAAVWWLKGSSPESAMGPLSIAIVVAFFMQWLMTAPKTFGFFKRALPIKEFFRPVLFSPEVRKVVAPFLLGAVGIGAVQINSALDTLFARAASLEGPAYLWYAIRIQQLPLALFGIALSSALLPPLSRAGQAGEWERFRTLLHSALTRSLSFILPSMAALLVGGAATINLLYGHGDFSQMATLETLLCLWGYAVGLLPAVFILLFAPAFYAQKDFKTPTRAALISVVVNVTLNALLVFVFGWGAASIAVATSVSALCNFLYLQKKLQPRTGVVLDSVFAGSTARIGLSTLSATALTLVIGRLFFADPTLDIFLGREALFSRHIPDQALHFTCLASLFLVSLFIAARLFQATELLSLIPKRRRPSA
ncbi:MAG: murein biosynthesis integral membrane protein MurJ [Chlamydiales bacterium]|nr:murein biosynthesis integral membrane protein MurJ [Chlamydiales bacterium]